MYGMGRQHTHMGDDTIELLSTSAGAGPIAPRRYRLVFRASLIILEAAPGDAWMIIHV